MATTGRGSQGPLTGVRVVELAGIGPGPFAAMLLADLGADVVRVDRPGGSVIGVEPAFDLTNRNKRSVLVDLKSEGGAGQVLDLVERADVLIEGYRPGVAERLGVGPDACLERNPRLVYGRMTGWGQDGPLAERAGHDIGYIALTGTLSMIGRAGEPPTVPANLVGDYAGGSLYLVVGVLAALQHARTPDGTGQVVDAAIVDGAAHLATMIHGMLAAYSWHDRRGTNLLDGGCPFYGSYATSDGEYMAVGALEPRFYEEFTRLLGIGDEAPDRNDLGRWEELRALVAERFSTRTRAEWTEIFEGTDACVAPVLCSARHPTTPTSPPAPPTWSTAASSSPPPHPASPRRPSPYAAAPRCPVRTPRPSPRSGACRAC